MNVFPQAIAMGNIHIGTIAGKLNGVMPPTIPSGRFRQGHLRIESDADQWQRLGRRLIA
jgi:hypothetical protein